MMSASAGLHFPAFLEVFETLSRAGRNFRLLDAAAFPTIGKNGPQVRGITVSESIEPLPRRIIH